MVSILGITKIRLKKLDRDIKSHMCSLNVVQSYMLRHLLIKMRTICPSFRFDFNSV